MRNPFNTLTPEDAHLIRSVLLQHDGGTLAPEFDREQRAALSLACDRLRLVLMDIEETVEKQN